MMYELTMTKNQTAIVRKAADEYGDLRINKWNAFVNDVGRSTDKHIQKQALNEFDQAMRTAWGESAPTSTDEMVSAAALAFYLRHQLPELDEEDSFALELGQEHAELVKVILEEYFRLRLNQWFDYATEVSCNGYVYDKEDPDNDNKFSAYIKRRDASKEKFEKAMQMLVPRYGRQTEDMLIAQDIWQVIRYRLYLDKGGDPNGAVVDARPPMQISQEPLPKFIRKKEGV